MARSPPAHLEDGAVPIQNTPAKRMEPVGPPNNEAGGAPSQDDGAAVAGADDDRSAEAARYLQRLLDEGHERTGGRQVPDLLPLHWITRERSFEDECLLHEEGVQRLQFGFASAKVEGLPVLQDASPVWRCIRTYNDQETCEQGGRRSNQPTW